MRRLAQLAIHLVLLVGWVLLIAAVGLWALERSGGLRWLVEHEAERRLAPLGEAVHIERARLDWFQPALLLAGVELGTEGDTLRLEQVCITLPSELPWGPDELRIEAADGHVVVSQALLNGLRGLLPDLEPAPPATRRIPTVQIENVQVALEGGARLGRIPLGRVDATLRADDDGRPALTGRLTPSLAAREGPGQVYIEGEELGDALYEVRAKAIDLPLSSDMVSERTAWTGLEPYAPRGLLALDARGRWNLHEGRLVDARARLSLKNGSLRAPTGELAIDELGFELEASLARASDPTSEALDALDPAAWRAFGRGSATCGRTPLRAELGWGLDAGPNAIARASLFAERADLGSLAAAIASSVPRTDEWKAALEPRGQGTLRVGLRLAELPPAGRPIQGALEIACAVDVDGAAGVTYGGFVSRLRGQRDIGFPLPVDEVAGRVVVAIAPGKLRTTRAGLIDLSGRGRQGEFSAHGVLSSPPVDLPPYLPGSKQPEMDLVLAAQGVPVDKELERSFAGLYGILPPSELWQRYRPAGGTLSAAVRLTHTHDMPVHAAEVRVGLHDVGLTWSTLPVPMLGMNGEVVFVSDGSTGWGVGFHGAGRLRTARSVAIAGRFQRETPEAATGRIDVLDVDVAHFSLAGDDQRVLTEVVAGLGESLARFEPRGFADLAYRRVHAVSDGPTETTVEVTAGDPVRLTPAQFKMATSDVRGRVLVRLTEPAPLSEGSTPGPGTAPAALARMEVDVAPIVGTWGQDVEVAFLSSQGADGATRTRVLGAGIDPASKSLLGSLAEALGNGGSAFVATDAFALDGRMDFSAALQTPAGAGLALGPVAAATSGAPELDGTYRFYLRDNRLTGANRLELSGLHGKLALDRGTLFGERLTGRLGRTPVVLSDATLTRNEQGFRFRTRVDARDVPLDREHLGSVMSEEALEPLIEELELSGTIDVEAGQLTIEGPPEGGTRVEFQGTLRPHDANVVLGLPLSIDSAAVRLHELVFETGKVRAWAEIEGLRGRVADRNVGPARMLVTYVQPRLSIENLDAVFEGGRAVPLGSGTARGGSAFSIDLVQPFPFQLAMDLRDVQIAGLLRGLFASSIATQGTLSCRLRLTGDTSRLLGLSGAGTFELNDSRLWSIPVFRALFSQLGLDDTAIFDSMSTNVRLRDGVIQTNDIEVHSPLLQLVGSGTVDLDGSLHHDLEVRYALLDYLGPLRRLFYSIQNRLLSVAIRGDMDRPSVKLRGPLSGLFGAGDDEQRELPLPDFAALPERF